MPPESRRCARAPFCLGFRAARKKTQSQRPGRFTFISSSRSTASPPPPPQAPKHTHILPAPGRVHPRDQQPRSFSLLSLLSLFSLSLFSLLSLSLSHANTHARVYRLPQGEFIHAINRLSHTHSLTHTQTHTLSHTHAHTYAHVYCLPKGEFVHAINSLEV